MNFSNVTSNNVKLGKQRCLTLREADRGGTMMIAQVNYNLKFQTLPLRDCMHSEDSKLTVSASPTFASQRLKTLLSQRSGSSIVGLPSLLLTAFCGHNAVILYLQF